MSRRKKFPPKVLDFHFKDPDAVSFALEEVCEGAMTDAYDDGEKLQAFEDDVQERVRAFFRLGENVHIRMTLGETPAEDTMEIVPHHIDRKPSKGKKQ